MSGVLTVVGTGIGPLTRVTPEAHAWIVEADDVVFMLDDPVVRRWIGEVRPDARSLQPLYEPGRHRRETYEAVVEAMLAPALAGKTVCAAFYGHPGVFVWPSHEAIRRARAAGIEATMLPAISSEDCLFADLGLDPGIDGCQSYEATNFLLYRRVVEPHAALVLWQVGALGDPGYPPRTTPERLGVLVEHLAQWYRRDHEVVLYEASPYPLLEPVVRRVELGRLVDGDIPAMATMYVPPLAAREPDPTMLARLGLRREDAR